MFLIGAIHSECGYLSSANVKQIEHPLSNLSEHLLARGLEKMTLQVTQNCNLRCKYCIYSEVSNLSQRSHNENAMSFETAKNAIDFFGVHSRDKKQVAIGFYGGEPLLEFQLIKDAVSYAKKIFEGKDLSFHITTNATLMTDEMAILPAGWQTAGMQTQATTWHCKRRSWSAFALNTA